MKYISTRDAHNRCAAADAIAGGLAHDGGLFAPEALPRLTGADIAALAELPYRRRAAVIMKRFLDDYTEAELDGFAAAAYAPFDHPAVAPLRRIDGVADCMELWHGPTCAFKDMALQMLPRLLTAALQKSGEDKTVCILTATSGDTGKAALEGFRDVDRTRIFVFYPKDGVSATQELQMVTQAGGNVDVCAVEGNFDDAQAGVKAIFSDEALRDELARAGYVFSSANSINWGRVLPQIVYYISAYCDLLSGGRISLGAPVHFCVPTGNFGNILAAFYAREMGLPIGRLICASNQNNVLTDFLTTGVYDRNRAFHTTLSPSMDILVSSNLERLLFALSGQDDAEVRRYMEQLAQTGRYEVSAEIQAKLGQIFCAGFCDDAQTKQTIARLWREHNYLIDPHTAVAFHVLDRHRAALGDAPVVVASTASPYKFSEGVLSALGDETDCTGEAAMERLNALTGVPIPAPLRGLSARPRRFDRTVPAAEMKDAVVRGLR